MSTYIGCTVEWNVPFEEEVLVEFWEHAIAVFQETFEVFRDVAVSPAFVIFPRPPISPPFVTPSARELSRWNVETLGTTTEADGRRSSRAVTLLGTPFETRHCGIFVSETSQKTLRMELWRDDRGCSELFHEFTLVRGWSFAAFDLVIDSHGRTMRERFQVLHPEPVESLRKGLAVRPRKRDYTWPLVGRIVRAQFELLSGLFDGARTEMEMPFLDPDFVIRR